MPECSSVVPGRQLTEIECAETGRDQIGELLRLQDQLNKLEKMWLG
jgi:hypothetical protein